MITISDLVREHRHYKDYSLLHQSIGDGYLVARNRIFQNVRMEALRLGVKFSDRVGLFDYHTCPNLAFDEIIRFKKIPYIRNAPSLVKMGKESPDLEIKQLLEITGNKVLHESCHIIAASILAEKDKQSKYEELRNRFVFSSLLGESFATACEATGQIDCQDDIHTWFYYQNTNSYGCQTRDYRERLNYLSKKLGRKFCIKLALLSFLMWNFYMLEVRREHIELIEIVCGDGRIKLQKDSETILKFCNDHFKIHSFFRREIASFYFQQAGFKESLATLLKIDFVSLFLRKKYWIRKIDQLASAVCDESTAV